MNAKRAKRRERRRAGRAVKQRVRAEWKQLRRRNRRILVTAIGTTMAAFALLIVGLQASGAHPFVLGMTTGIAIAVIPFYFFLVKVSTGIAAREFGGDAEQWTAEEIDKLDDRLWRVFHDVPVAWGNVDHVAVGPGRVYAIETKWTTAGGRYRQQSAAQAARQADRLRAALASHGVEREVIPLLVIWGYRVADDLEHRSHIDEETRTRIVAGADAAHWLGRMQQAADRFAVDWPATKAVRAVVQDGEGAVTSS